MEEVREFGQKAVMLEKKDLDGLQIGALSDALRNAIAALDLKSLKSLLGADSEKLMRQLIEEYWNKR